MAYPPLRSMRGSLLEGSVDGRVKKLRPDAQASDGELTAEVRRNLSLPYYGVLEPRTVLAPGTVAPAQRPDFIPNHGTDEERGPVFGKTW